jgi:hypothetical protein
VETIHLCECHHRLLYILFLVAPFSSFSWYCLPFTYSLHLSSFHIPLAAYDFVIPLSFKMKSSLLIQTFLFAHFSIAGYVIEDEYNPSNFLDGFTAFTGEDPTQGFGMAFSND